MLLQLFNLISMYKVIWQNTEIKIPLYDNVNTYFELPSVELYKDNKKINTKKYYIEKGVNRTHLSIINSNHVRDYKIDYRVTFYEHNIVSEQTITFSIIDNIEPEILFIPEIKKAIGSKRLTEKEIINVIEYKDNYYNKEDLNIYINYLDRVDVNKVGKYLIEVIVIDPSYNKARKEFYYEIYSKNSIEIKYLKKLVHNIDEKFDYTDYFEIKDKYNNKLKVDIFLDEVDFYKPGKYPITIYAYNLWGDEQYFYEIIEIKDLSPPRIYIDYNIKPINIYTNNFNPLKYIIKVDDNYDLLNIEDIEVTHKINFSKIGKYPIEYNLCDSSNNCVKEKIEVEVKDIEPPKISKKDEIVINVFETVDFSKYFDIKDNFTHFKDLKIIYNDKDIDYNKEGYYYLYITVEDSSKNIAFEKYKVEIKDLLPPEIKQKDDIIIFDFKKDENKILSFFEIKDNYSNDLEIIINDSKVNYNKKGQYELSIIAIDKSNNKTTYITNIYIIDLSPPTIELTTEKYKYFIGDKKKDLKDSIKEISDNYDEKKDLKLKINSNIKYDTPGLYKVEYIVSDISENKVKKELNFYVDVKKEKIINVENIKIKQYEKIDFEKYINKNNNLYKLDIFPNYINTNIAGVQYVTYVAYDKRGNKEVIKQKIEIEKKEESFIIKYKIVIILLLGYISIIFIIIYENKNNTTFDK